MKWRFWKKPKLTLQCQWGKKKGKYTLYQPAEWKGEFWRSRCEDCQGLLFITSDNGDFRKCSNCGREYGDDKGRGMMFDSNEFKPGGPW